MGPIEGKDLERVRDVLAKHEVEYLFVGKMAAILQGYPDTTQDADLFVEKTAENGERLTAALKELGFNVTDELAEQIRRGKDFIQLTDGPFDLDLCKQPGTTSRCRKAEAFTTSSTTHRSLNRRSRVVVAPASRHGQVLELAEPVSWCRVSRPSRTSAPRMRSATNCARDVCCWPRPDAQVRVGRRPTYP